ncbi:hypothetical protein OUO28_03485 [Chryseobacterium sp. CY353]|nr:hypothetical protein [Chryseobacterium sp. CY353]MCY0968149.1 hypothetical protein [Chryseobacterium sp. CY353]
MIKPNFNKKFVFETLCLKITIARTAPIVPPINVRINKENSEILILFFTAFHLSNEKVKKVIRLMTIIKYNIMANLKQNKFNKAFKHHSAE